jgi:hypothetical protein
VTEQPPPGSGGPLQFDQVELPTAATTIVQRCAACKRPIAGTYYETNGAVLDPACAERLGGKSGGVAGFPVALLYGVGAALAGTLVWYLLMKAMRGTTLGIFAIALGYAVGRAVRIGTGGRGGAVYQALAMLLTYASICASDALYVLQRFDAAGTEKILFIFGAALVAPFTSGLRDILGLAIIGIAVYEAWKLNKPLVVTGPFRVAAAAPPPAGTP